LEQCIEAERKECLEKETYDWRSVNNAMKKMTIEIQNLGDGPASAKTRAENLAFTVLNKNNYEGNIICYVNMRTKGTDNVSQVKATIQNRDNKWVVVAYEVRGTCSAATC